MSYGTATRKVTVELTFERQWDIGGPDTPDTDYVYLDSARVVAGSLPEEFVNALPDEDDDSGNWDTILNALGRS